MKVAIVLYVTSKCDYISDWIHEVSDRIEACFYNFDNNDLKSLYFGVHYEHDREILEHNLQFKIYKKDKRIEVDIEIDYKTNKSKSKEEFIETIYDSIIKTCIELFSSPSIKISNSDFIIKEFERLRNSMPDKKELEYIKEVKTKVADQRFKNLLNAIERGKKEEQSKIPDELKFNEDTFWEIIETSFGLKETYNYKHGCEALFEALKKLDNQAIINFNVLLRKKLVELESNKLPAICKTIFGSVSDSTINNFRYNIISRGTEVFQIALVAPVKLFSLNINWDYSGEDLHYIADDAIKIKNGNVFNDNLPSEVANEIFGSML